MDVRAAIRGRGSIRAFQPVAVAAEKLGRVREAGRLALAAPK